MSGKVMLLCCFSVEQSGPVETRHWLSALTSSSPALRGLVPPKMWRCVCMCMLESVQRITTNTHTTPAPQTTLHRHPIVRTRVREAPGHGAALIWVLATNLICRGSRCYTVSQCHDFCRDKLRYFSILSPCISLPVSTSPPHLAPDLEQARPQTSGEEELQLQLALAMSREESEKVRITYKAHIFSSWHIRCLPTKERLRI